MKTLTHAVPSHPTYSWTRTLARSKTTNRTVLAEMVTPATPPDSFFDANGNLSAMENLRGLAWDFRDQLASVTLIARPANDEDDTEWYLYDASGTRVRKVTQRIVNAGATLEDKVYLAGYEIKRGFTGTSLAGAPQSDRRTLRIDHGGQRALVLHRWTKTRSGPLPPPQFRYQHGTEQGSCALELDGRGLVLSYEEYTPFGGTSIIAGNAQTEVKRKDYRYSGKECDDSTGLYYYGARYYAPWVGRWISCDPAGTIDGPNLYAFVGGNPVTNRDETGLTRHRVRGALTGLTGARTGWIARTLAPRFFTNVPPSTFAGALPAVGAGSRGTHRQPDVPGGKNRLERSLPSGGGGETPEDAGRRFMLRLVLMTAAMMVSAFIGGGPAYMAERSGDLDGWGNPREYRYVTTSNPMAGGYHHEQMTLAKKRPDGGYDYVRNHSFGQGVLMQGKVNLDAGPTGPGLVDHGPISEKEFEEAGKAAETEIKANGRYRPVAFPPWKSNNCVDFARAHREAAKELNPNLKDVGLNSYHPTSIEQRANQHPPN